MKRVTVCFLALFFHLSWVSVSGQFQVEFEAFTPGEATVIQMLENNPAEPFMGTATNGSEVSFESLKGKPMLLWFWDVKDELCLGQIDGLNLMHQIFSDEVSFVGFAYDKKPFIDELTESKLIDFPILPNSFRLGELHYGSELGQGRVFLVDRSGMVVRALPRSFFIGNNRSFNDLRAMLGEL